MSQPFFAADGITISLGDCLTVLPTLPGASVHTCVSSPPFWRLRDYGVEGQLGHEPVHDCQGWAGGSACGECYVCRLVAVFREVRRVLRSDGTLWLNLGDAFASASVCRRPSRIRNGKLPDGTRACDLGRLPAGLKAKDLCALPWRVALALQADGWFLRCDIIWSKRNSLPESVTDRPTRSHEYLFLLTKSRRYFYDNDAIREPVQASTIARDRYKRTTKGKDGPYWKGSRQW